MNRVFIFAARLFNGIAYEDCQLRKVWGVASFCSAFYAGSVLFYPRLECKFKQLGKEWIYIRNLIWLPSNRCVFTFSNDTGTPNLRKQLGYKKPSRNPLYPKAAYQKDEGYSTYENEKDFTQIVDESKCKASLEDPRHAGDVESLQNNEASALVSAYYLIAKEVWVWGLVRWSSLRFYCIVGGKHQVVVTAPILIFFFGRTRSSDHAG